MNVRQVCCDGIAVLRIQDRTTYIYRTMKQSKHSEEEIHTAMDKIGGFVYQFYYFLYLVLTMKRGEIVSFEKLDDAAVEKDDVNTLYQTKHTIKKGADGEKTALTNRSTDLWKAIDVWRKLVEGNTDEGRTFDDMSEYIKDHKFVFVSNKMPDDNKFVKLCKEVNDGAGQDRIDEVLNEITKDGRAKDATSTMQDASTCTTQNMIDGLRSFELREEFIKKISFETRSQDEIQNDCIAHIADTVWYSEEKAPIVFNDFLTEAILDFSENADKGTPLSYTFEERHKRFESVFQFHREEKLDFRIKMEKYKNEFLDLVCIQQLIKVRDFAASETDKVAKYASHFYSFKNRYNQLVEDSKILDHEDMSFRDNAITFWENEFDHAYNSLDDKATEEEIDKKAKDILYEVRKHKLKLCDEYLETAISNGAFYYLSDECVIGWHRDWKNFFEKLSSKDGQDNQ